MSETLLPNIPPAAGNAAAGLQTATAQSAPGLAQPSAEATAETSSLGAFVRAFMQQLKALQKGAEAPAAAAAKVPAQTANPDQPTPGVATGLNGNPIALAVQTALAGSATPAAGGSALPPGGKGLPVATDTQAAPVDAETPVAMLPVGPVVPQDLVLPPGLAQHLIATQTATVQADASAAAANVTPATTAATATLAPDGARAPLLLTPAAQELIHQAALATSGKVAGEAVPMQTAAAAEPNVKLELPALQALTASPHPQQFAPPTSLNALSQAAPQSALFQSDIPVPVQQPGWDQALAQRVQWMVGKQMQGAEIKLTPPNLGALEVRVSVSHDQTNVSFTSPHAAVRDAIESAMPRLREMLADNGLNLGNVNVSEHSQADQRRQDAAAAFRGGERGDGPVSASPGEPGEIVRHGVGLLDTFA